jgi:hypothetical protein
MPTLPTIPTPVAGRSSPAQLAARQRVGRARDGQLTLMGPNVTRLSAISDAFGVTVAKTGTDTIPAS